MIAVPLVILVVLGLERFPPCPAGNQSDPNPAFLQCYHPNPKPPECRDCPGFLLWPCSLWDLVSALCCCFCLLSHLQSMVCAQGPGACGHTGRARGRFFLSPLALWDVAAGPRCCQGCWGAGKHRELQQARGSGRDLPHLRLLLPCTA